jgi:alkaline phosphatase
MATRVSLLILILLSLALAQEFHQERETYHTKREPTKQPKLELSSLQKSLKDLENYEEFWNANAEDYISRQLKLKKSTKKAKNLILFIGDGLSIATTSATRVYLGGEEVQLSYEKFPHYGLSKTYCVDRQVPDSACTATALLTGIKNNYNGIGVTANVLRGQCTFTDNDIVHSIAKWAQDAHKATGVVTTTRITHATPACQ